MTNKRLRRNSAFAKKLRRDRPKSGRNAWHKNIKTRDKFLTKSSIEKRSAGCISSVNPSLAGLILCKYSLKDLSAYAVPAPVAWQAGTRAGRRGSVNIYEEGTENVRCLKTNRKLAARYECGTEGKTPYSYTRW